MIGADEVFAAKDRIASYISYTPMEKFAYLSQYIDGSVFLKLECKQVLNTFKTRGAFNKILKLSLEDRKKGVITASSGNHGAAVSYAAKIAGISSVEVYVSNATPEAKREKIEKYGAQIIIAGENYDEAHAAAKNAVKSRGLVWIDSCSDEDVIAGQGTIGVEILEKNSDIDVIVVPIGGGGIITGISIGAKSVKPDVKIIGVQTEACPAMLAAIRDNVFYEEYPTEPSICEALVGGVGEIPFKMAHECIDDILLVKEENIKKAVTLLYEMEGIIAEPSAVVGVGCIMEHREYFKGKNAAVVITGGNIDEKLLEKIIIEK